MKLRHETLKTKKGREIKDLSSLLQFESEVAIKYQET